MDSKTTAINPNTTTGSGGEFKITFYSTSPNDESKSKYPMQTKTSYTVPDIGGGDTEINFGKSVAASSRPKTRFTGFRPGSGEQRDDSKRDSRERNTSYPSSDGSNDFVRSRGGRVIKKPKRYEPVETVTDDFDDNDYDSGNSSEN